MNQLTIRNDQPQGTISRNIYGCFADEYHWMDGIGPRERRPKMINTHWGGTVEAFTDFRREGDALHVQLPARSVAVLAITAA